MLISRDWNCSRMTAGNTSGHALHQYGILTTIEGWSLVYQEVDKSKIISEYRLSGIL